MEEDTIRPFLQQLDINMVTLGNNHIMDYGEAGFAHTVSFLNEHKISYVGGGINLIEAKKPRILDINGLSIGILNFAENEWSIAGENRAGANPLDIVDNVSQIKSLKMMCDKVICIIHGGHEMYSLPSPRMVKQYHFYADSGADVIIGHHTHCILPYEVYRSVPIIYGLGNFIFTIPSQYSDWYTGGVLELEIKDSKPIEFKLFFVKQDDMSFSAHLMGGLQKRELEQKIENQCCILQSEDLLMAKWKELVREKSSYYINNFKHIFPFCNRIIGVLFDKFSMSDRFICLQSMRRILNLFRCESHRDIMLASIENGFSNFPSRNREA
jgi:poly-gamma-glutamate synthesis protein (capsule biosynthesis protein)